MFTLDEIYSACVSCVLFFRILAFLDHLKVNFHLYVMRQTLVTSSQQLGGYGFALTTALVAFSSFFYLSRGSVSGQLKSLLRTIVTLVMLVVGQGKYRCTFIKVLSLVHGVVYKTIQNLERLLSMISICY